MSTEAGKLFDDSSVPFSMEAQIKAVEREIKMREAAYPKWVEGGTMKPAQAEYQIGVMRAVLATLQSLARASREDGTFADDARLIEVRAYLRANAEEGVPCPACQQLVKIYTRSFTSSMARNLIAIYKHAEASGEEWINVPELLAGLRLGRGNDGAFMANYGVIERDPETPERSGMYRITDLGRNFVLGKTRIRKYVRRYNQRNYRCDDLTMISIEEALGNDFSYRELMELKAPGEQIL